jgi:hypothetical protein
MFKVGDVVRSKKTVVQYDTKILHIKKGDIFIIAGFLNVPTPITHQIARLVKLPMLEGRYLSPIRDLEHVTD